MTLVAAQHAGCIWIFMLDGPLADMHRPVSVSVWQRAGLPAIRVHQHIIYVAWLPAGCEDTGQALLVGR